MSSGDSRVNGTTPEQIEADLARQREELAATVTEIQARLDVKAGARAKAVELRARATTPDGKPRPAVAAAQPAPLAARLALRPRPDLDQPVAAIDLHNELAARISVFPFRERFERKGRFVDYMKAIPTQVILHKHAALLGAARVAFAEAD